MPFLEFTAADGRADRIEYNLYEPAGGRPGSTLVLYLHGLIADQGGDKATFLRAHVLAAGCAYGTFDFRGHGGSTRTLAELTQGGLVEDVAQVVARLRPPGRRLALIGSSMGGWAGAWYAVRPEARVDACFLIAPSFRLLVKLVESQSAAELAAWRAAGTKVFAGPYGGFELGWRAAEETRRWRFEELTAAWRTPTLIVQGMQDDSVPWEQAVEFARAARGGGGGGGGSAVGAAAAPVDVVLLRDGDHRLTARKEFLAALLVGFLRERGLAAGGAG